MGEAVRIAREVAGALDYAHRRGVVHRDIKPENILLQDGQAIVADFGIARAIDAAGADRAETGGTGTPAYMSPEQRVRGAVVDGRADLYSLGCVLYEMLAGEPPFSGASAEEIGSRQASDPSPSLLGRGLDVPAAVDQTVSRAMAGDPAARFATGAELRDALGDAGDGSAAGPPTANPSVRWRWTLAGGALLLGLAALGVRASRAPVELQLGHRTRLTLDPGLEIDAALSPDGRRLVYAAGPASQVALYTSPVGRRVPKALAPGGPRPQRLPSWSPDGRRILFRSPRGIEMIAAGGGDPRVLVPDPGPSPADSGRLQGSTTVLMPGGWAPDDRRFVFSRRDSLFVGDTTGAPVRLLANGVEPHSAVWSPDGRRIAYVTGNRQALETGFFFGNAGRSAIWITGAGGGRQTRVSPAASSDTRPTWLPDSRGLLFISDRDGGRDIYETRLGGEQPAAARVTTGLNPFTLSLSADGRQLAYTVLTESSNIWALPIPSTGPVSSAEAHAVTAGSQVIEGLDVSPDGRWLAFDGDRSGTPGIYRVSLQGGEPERLTGEATSDFGPQWSPDGHWIAFHSFHDGARHIFVMSDRGSDRAQVTRGAGDDRGPVWLSGRQILYRAQLKDREEVRVVARGRDGGWGEPKTILRGDILQVAVSPDGTRLAFATPRGLEVSSASGTAVRMLVGGHDLPGGRRPDYVAWSDDGRLIYFLALDLADRATIWSVPARGGMPRLLVTFDDPTREWHRYGFRARHGKFWFTLGDRQSDIWQMDIAAGGTAGGP